MNKIYYQPLVNGELPEGLFSFQVFKTAEDAKDWMVEHGIEGVYDILEYQDDEIENPTFIDACGDTITKIEDIDIYEEILSEVIWNAGSEGNLKTCKQDDETQQEYEDRVWEEAHDLVMDAIVSIEEDDFYDFSTYWDEGDGVAWYDEVREDVIREVVRIMTDETE